MSCCDGLDAESYSKGERTNRLKVGIAASGRFHLLDLARELDALGVDVAFYSYVTRKRANSFGLSRRCHVALFPFLFPLVALERLVPNFFPRIIERIMCWALEAVVILRMRRCDVFVCMSGMYLSAARFAKWRYGALVHLHRSSRHIMSQKEILAGLPGAQQVSEFMVRRELTGYAIADHIMVPSTHVVESFALWPEYESKLFLNPLGVDTKQFPLRKTVPSPDKPTVLFVGQWSYRKGVDLLAEAIRALDGVRMIHVGALSDVKFPDDLRFIHYDHVPQQKLTEFYGRAHIFVLPSREDGFGVVISQALSSGLQVVCTDRTGGPDLARFPGISRLLRIVPAGNPQALRLALIQSLDSAIRGTCELITDAERDLLGWKSYAERDLKFMEQALEIRPPVASII